MELCIHTSFCCSNQVLLFPLWASARLPLFLAAIAELGLASARHVETSKIEFNKSLTSRAPCPFSLFRQSENVLVIGIFLAHVERTCARVYTSFTRNAGLSLAPRSKTCPNAARKMVHRFPLLRG